MTAIKRDISIINPDHLQSDERYICNLAYDMFPEETHSIYIKKTHLVFHSKFKSILTQDWRYSQSEFPLASLGWIIETITNKFWKSSGPVNLESESIGFKTLVDGELIGINPMLHCCAENVFGYNIWNSSRNNHITQSPPQACNIPRYMLQDEGVIEQLQQINADYLAGKFDDLAR